MAAGLLSPSAGYWSGLGPGENWPLRTLQGAYQDAIFSDPRQPPVGEGNYALINPGYTFSSFSAPSNADNNQYLSDQLAGFQAGHPYYTLGCVCTDYATLGSNQYLFSSQNMTFLPSGLGAQLEADRVQYNLNGSWLTKSQLDLARAQFNIDGSPAYEFPQTLEARLSHDFERDYTGIGTGYATPSERSRNSAYWSEFTPTAAQLEAGRYEGAQTSFAERDGNDIDPGDPQFPSSGEHRFGANTNDPDAPLAPESGRIEINIYAPKFIENPDTGQLERYQKVDGKWVRQDVDPRSFSDPDLPPADPTSLEFSGSDTGTMATLREKMDALDGGGFNGQPGDSTRGLADQNDPLRRELAENPNNRIDDTFEQFGFAESEDSQGFQLPDYGDSLSDYFDPSAYYGFEGVSGPGEYNPGVISWDGYDWTDSGWGDTNYGFTDYGFTDYGYYDYGYSDYGYSDYGFSDFDWAAPIVIGFSNGSARLINTAEDSSVWFDMSGDGVAEQTQWAAKGDGVLAIDANQDGKIDQRSEVVFTDWDATAKSDIEALRHVFDSNGDKYLTSADARWNDFRVVVDGQARTLAEAGISYIGTEGVDRQGIYSRGSFETPEGTTVDGLGTVGSARADPGMTK